jgi:hypothetical protein
MDRRITFFLGAAVACLLLVPLAEEKFRWVPIVTGVAYVLLAGAVALEQRSKRRDRR